MFKAGQISGVSMIAHGEALGHGLWCDTEFVGSVADLAADQPKGVKARFTHPGLSGDGMGTFLGRLQAGHISDDGEKAVADLHFSQAAHRSPDGDLANYVMDLAEGDPAAFGASIVFEHDWAAEKDLLLSNGAEEKEDDWGKYLSLKNFVSPDPLNVKNLPHARLAELRACDVVDDPAANPDGLFYRRQDAPQQADSLLSYACGLSDTAPASTMFSVHPDRVKGFVGRFLESHNLKIVGKDSQMSTEQTTAEAETQGETKPEGQAEESQSQAPAGSQPEGSPTGEEAKPEAETSSQEPVAGSQEEAKPESDTQATDNGLQATASEARLECGRFIAAFGSQGGQWYAEGLSFEQAQEKHTASLRAENEALRTRLAAAGESLGETEPLSFQPEGAKGAATGGKKCGKFTNKLSPCLSRFAEGIKLPAKQ